MLLLPVYKTYEKNKTKFKSPMKNACHVSSAQQ